MLKKRWDKSRMPSRHVTEGPGRAPHRSYYYAMGLTEDEIKPALRGGGDVLERGGAVQHRTQPAGRSP